MFRIKCRWVMEFVPKALDCGSLLPLSSASLLALGL